MIYLVAHPSEQVDTPVVISRGPVGSVQLGLYFTKWDEPPSRGPEKEIDMSFLIDDANRAPCSRFPCFLFIWRLQK